MGKFQSANLSGLYAIELIDEIIPEYEHLEVFHVMADIQSAMGNKDKEREYTQTYYKASQQYFSDQNELIKIKEEFQIDLLLAGLHAEFDKEANNYMYKQYFIFTVTSIMLLIIVWLEIRRNNLNATGQAIRKIIDSD